MGISKVIFFTKSEHWHKIDPTRQDGGKMVFFGYISYCLQNLKNFLALSAERYNSFLKNYDLLKMKQTRIKNAIHSHISQNPVVMGEFCG